MGARRVTVNTDMAVIRGLLVAACALALLTATTVAAPARSGPHKAKHHKSHKKKKHKKRKPKPKPAASPAPSATAAPPQPAAAPPPVVGALTATRPFAADSVWNAPLPADAALDTLSATYVANVQSMLTRYAPYVNTTQYSTPVYRVGPGQPTVKVTLDNTQANLRAAFEQVPIPDDARPAAGTDGHLVVWQAATDTMWEFWRMTRQADGWHAVYGGRMAGVSRNPGYFADNPRWGATATGLPLLGGLMQLDELVGAVGGAAPIDHALALGLPELRRTVFSRPALRTDGTVDSPTAIPEGTRFRIDPALDLDTVPMAPLVRVMAEAAQKYGMIVRDRAGAVAFFAEDPSQFGVNPFAGPAGLLGNQSSSVLLRQFPWAHLQALRTDLRNQTSVQGRQDDRKAAVRRAWGTSSPPLPPSRSARRSSRRRPSSPHRIRFRQARSGTSR